MFTESDRLEKIKLVQGRTYTNMCEVLERDGICNVDRPCGFGKTYVFSKWVSQQKYNVLYFWETTDIRDNVRRYFEDKNSKNLRLMSYAAFFRMKAEEAINYLVENKIEALVFDESHRCGARTIREKWDTLIEFARKNKIKILGGSGTVIRSDGTDVTTDMFSGHSVFTYGVSEALSDGLLREPWYFSADTREVDMTDMSEDDKRIIIDASNPEDIIKDALDTSEIDTNYMKFIIYYPSITEVNNHYDYWINCFRNLFPEKEVRVVPVTSSKKHKEGMKHIDEMMRRDNAVDVFICVDMMNQGVHFDDLTGIVMCRRTESAIIYTQQIGRCMSISNTRDMLVIDMVGNIESQFMVDNPLAQIIGKDNRGRKLGDNTGWRETERRKIHMSVKQQKRAAVINKLLSAQSIKERGTKLAMQAYVKYPDHDFSKICKALKVDLGNTLMSIYYAGDLRDEDVVPELDADDGKSFSVRLQNKWNEVHKNDNTENVVV